MGRRSQEEVPRREFYQVVPPSPRGGFWGLNGWGLLVGVAARSVGAMILRFRAADKETIFASPYFAFGEVKGVLGASDTIG